MKKSLSFSPDIGGTKRAEQFRCALAAELHDEPSAAFVEKRRSGGVVTGELLVGDVGARAVILFDDLISTGTTLQRAARSCCQAGATRIFAAATHGLFMGQAPTLLADPVFEGIAVTDTSVQSLQPRGGCRKTLSTSTHLGLVADEIIAAHSGQ